MTETEQRKHTRLPRGWWLLTVALVLAVLVAGAFAVGRSTAPTTHVTRLQAPVTAPAQMGPMMHWLHTHPDDLVWMRAHVSDIAWLRAHPHDWAWMRNHWQKWDRWRMGTMSGRTGGPGPG